MKKTFLLLSALPTFCMLHAEEVTPVAKVSVKQGDASLESTQIQLKQKPTFQFDANGNLIMTLGDGSTHVAELPMQHGASMSVEFKSKDDASCHRTVSVNQSGYATMFSAFQTIVPEGAAVYAPTFDNEKKELILNAEAQLPAGTTLPAGTGIIIKGGDPTATFNYAATETPAAVSSALSGTAIGIPSSGLDNIFVLDTKEGISFCQHTGTNLSAGQAYMVLEQAVGIQKITLLDTTTGIEELGSYEATQTTLYNLNGQRIEVIPSHGLFIQRGKKSYNK